MSTTCATPSAEAQSNTGVTTKAAILVLSDPKPGSEEALGRVFNALAAAYEFKTRGEDVTILFNGAGTRWIGELSKEDHPAHALFEEVKDKVDGVSCGCADVFGGAEDAKQSGFRLIKDNLVPGTTGLPSLQDLVSQGFAILTF